MIEINSKMAGAELTSIKYNGEEKLHDGVNDWQRHAPILFPIVGKFKNGESIIENKICKMSQHGFARDMDFEKIGENSYLLKYNDETLEKYPYKFELKVFYEISDNSVKTNYEVKNVDNKEIKFGLGAHPAYKCNYEKCELEFERDEDDVKAYLLDQGLVKTEPEDSTKIINGNKIVLNEKTFENDAIIFKGLKSNKVCLKENGKKVLEFDFSDFPILAIWSKLNAKFLCIEPWFNTADKIDSDGVFENKENIIKLNIGETFKCSYTVKFF